LNYTTEILIIGAGPGGVATALQLAKQNISCIIVDKANFPRNKICGDALSGKVVEVLKKIDVTLLNDFQLQPIQLGSWGVSFVAPNNKVLEVPFKQNFDIHNQQPPGYISKRIHFDNFLFNVLKKFPDYIQVLENTDLTIFDKTDSGYKATSKDGAIIIDAKLVIAADGAQSRFARYTGDVKVEPKHYCAGVRAYYKNVSGMHNANFIELHFIKDLLPGYFWIFPLPNGEVNIGVGIRSDKISKHKLNLKNILNTIIQQHPEISKRFVNAEMVDDVKGFGLPLGSKKRSISGDNYLLIGDAASLIDPFTGEGIGNAMMSGLFAANHAMQCLQKNNFSCSFNKQYDNDVYKRLWSELKLSRTMQQLVVFPWLFNFVVNKAATNTTLRETISAMFEDLDLRDRLRKPSFYLDLIFSK
jgi:geranylgeranyl reductase family protein